MWGNDWEVSCLRSELVTSGGFKGALGCPSCSCSLPQFELSPNSLGSWLDLEGLFVILWLQVILAGVWSVLAAGLQFCLAYEGVLWLYWRSFAILLPIISLTILLVSKLTIPSWLVQVLDKPQTSRAVTTGLRSLKQSSTLLCCEIKTFRRESTGRYVAIHPSHASSSRPERRPVFALE